MAVEGLTAPVPPVDSSFRLLFDLSRQKWRSSAETAVRLPPGVLSVTRRKRRVWGTRSESTPSPLLLYSAWGTLGPSSCSPPSVLGRVHVPQVPSEPLMDVGTARERGGIP